MLNAEVWTAINQILDREMDQAVQLPAENTASIDALVAELLSKNYLPGNEIDAIFRRTYPAAQPGGHAGI